MLYDPYDLLPIYNVCEKPLTLYSLLESIVNYGKDEKTKIKDLAKIGRSTIFDFDYPLTSNIDKEDFECMILNHFIMRRIGFPTTTSFKIQLNVKLNEIMPMYNKMFDMLEGWDIFNDGERLTRNVSDSRNKQNTIDTENSSTSNDRITTSNTDTITENNTIEGSTSTENTLNNESTTTTNSTNDKRHSDTPQNDIQDVQNGSYVSDYTLTTENSTATDNSESTGSSSSTNESEETKSKNGTSNGTENRTNTTGSTSNVVESRTDTGTLTETITKSPADKIKLYKEFMENRQSIYSMIFKELECLFFQII